MRILLTTTSFQDTRGSHHAFLNEQGYDIDRLSGPATEELLLPIISKYDAVICGDDDYTEKVIKTGADGNLKLISKYGVGLDRIDLKAAKKYGVFVTNCPGVNTRSVAEHVLALVLCFYRKIHLEFNITISGGWERITGHEIYKKTIAILGLGGVGRDVAKIFKALGLNVKVYDAYLDEDFVLLNKLKPCSSIEELIKDADILTLHIPLKKQTEGIINIDLLRNQNVKDLLIVNTARAGLIKFETIETALNEGIMAGYCTDVMYEEPMPPQHPLKDLPNVLITPHIGSRTFQSVERQGKMAVENVINFFKAK